MKEKLLSAIQNGKAFVLMLSNGKDYVISSPAQIEYPPNASYVIVHDCSAPNGKFAIVFFAQISDVGVEP
jgi:hypothetical protein